MTNTGIFRSAPGSNKHILVCGEMENKLLLVNKEKVMF